jgi:hypothetical protein
VAEDLGLTPARISQICKLVGVWYGRVHDELLPDVEDSASEAIRFLIGMRLAAQRAMLAPSNENPVEAVRRLLDELMGVRLSDQPFAYRPYTALPGS